MKYYKLLLFRLLSFIRFVLGSHRIQTIRDPELKDQLLDALNFNKKSEKIREIESWRQQLLRSDQLITRTDFGAGSAFDPTSIQKVSSIASHSLSSESKCQFLATFAHSQGAKQILELGTSLGISTAYLSVLNPNALITSLEGDPAVAKLARSGFDQLRLGNIHLIEGEFERVLPEVLSQRGPFDFVYIDGNHTYEATLAYYQQFYNHISSGGMLIFDDIYWSKSMSDAWSRIFKSTKTGLFIDFYQLGMVQKGSDKTQYLRIFPGWKWFL